MGLQIYGRYDHCYRMTNQHLLEHCAACLEIFPMENIFRGEHFDNHFYSYKVDEKE